jgi:FkbM family methyltransferase
MLVPPNFLSYRNFAVGLYEKDVTRLFLEILKSDMTVVDVGASIGYYTLIASRIVGPKGKVYAFEPEERNYSYLVRNLSANHASNVVTIRKAASNKAGKSAFISEGAGERGWVPENQATSSPIKVDTLTLDSFFEAEGWPSVDVVKMDIEGSEKFALEGMRELSRRNHQMRLIMEFNLDAMRRTGIPPQALADTLMELGFTRGYIIERNLKAFPIVQGLKETSAIYNLLFTKQ